MIAVNTKDDGWNRVFTENDVKFPESFKINLNASEGSTLKGSVELNPSNKISDPAKQTQVNLNDSTWLYDKNSTINGNLSGNAHFTLNTDLAAQQGDKVVVKGRTDGAHKITVQNSKNEPKSSGGRLNLVETLRFTQKYISRRRVTFFVLGCSRFQTDRKEKNMNPNIPTTDENVENQNSTFDLSPAAEMEAEERELVIEDSVDSAIRYAEKPLSDAQIEARSLSEEEIVPDSGAVGGLETEIDR